MPELLPKCLLIDLIKKKSRQVTSTPEFDYITQLSLFLANVKRDIPDIHVLFPQFTPHDDLHHLEPLFRLASALLGETLLNQLNVSELFLLACALYGHDWGMAVNAAYKHEILLGKTSKGPNRAFDQDLQRLALFTEEMGIRISIDSGIKHMSLDLWREFIRKTHPQRSAERIRNHFETIDTGIAIRLAQICESHGEDCEKLRDQDLYPLRCSVLGEVVNVRAIAIYLRLCDLFDIADNRTPYAIWKYVAPTDPQSIQEWDKHRAIRQVTFPSYPDNTRHILVDGLTDNHELYADLMDLEAYCRREFRLCKDMLSEMPDPKYCLDIVDIDWKINTEGFKPLAVRFEFDRDRILGFLSYELYQGDKLVFLRELLQNSIDAIRMRRELLEKSESRIDVRNLGCIEVFTETLLDGSITVVWKDDGIGMDENTILNFVAVVGRSYYRSHDFERLHLEMDPISQFGIGLLTCFTVSDSLEIVTKRDRNIFGDSKPLKVVIPGLDRYFRIEEIKSSRGVNTGTTIKLTINTKAISSVILNDDRSKIITDYLARIAGFVEFPIVVHEGKNQTIILHPKAKVSDAKSRFGSNYEIVQLRLDCTLNDIVITQDISVARQLFKIETYDLAKDLGLEDYEGVLSYPVPMDENTDFTHGQRGYNAFTVMTNNQPSMKGRFVRMTHGWQGQLLPTQNGSEEIYYECAKIYRDGILVPHAKIHASVMGGYSYGNNLMRLIVNIPKNRSKEINLTRDQIVTNSREWARPIFDAHVRMLAAKHPVSEMKNLQPSRYLFKLASFMFFRGLSTKQISEIFPRDDWPFLFLQANGKIGSKRYKEIINCNLNLSPYPMTRINAHLIRNLMEDTDVQQLYSFWKGPDTLIDNYATWSGDNNDSIILGSLRNLIEQSIEMGHRFNALVFLEPPWNGSPPMLQEVWVPKLSSDSLPDEIIESKLNLLARNPSNAIELEQPNVQESYWRAIGMARLHFRLTRFSAPFKESFAYGSSAMNLNNPISRALLHLMLIAFARKDQWAIPPSELNSIRLILRRISNLPGAILSDYTEWANSTDDLWKVLNRIGLTSNLGVKTLTPTADQFIPGSTEQFLDIKVNDSWHKPFGEILK